ncbi:MAG: hydroxymethylglutaryl-CoA reductase, degradative [Spirochaetaceae bacterium]|nr:MAG: hydroxymethylglutaryl-CoA reductase, degradative [Spirochaetaceae bacterium]
MLLPAAFRKLEAREKRRILETMLQLTPDEVSATNPGGEMIDLADVMVESAVGVMPIPMGIASGIKVDGVPTNIPMAVEEPSVVAAATFAGRLVTQAGGGFTTAGTGQVMTAQVAIDDVAPGALTAVRAAEKDLKEELREILGPMTRRGGGYRGMEAAEQPETGLLVVHLHVDTCDAMGANIINTAAEALRSPLERITGGTVLMAILTNAAPRRRVRASFSVPVKKLGRGPYDGPTMGRRIVRANEFALADRLRAVTHNKGIMNGITALATATGNDTRAIEAAVHAYAARDGRYRALTEYSLREDHLEGTLEIPLAMGTVGGAVGFHPVSTFALKVLFPDDGVEPSADRLARVAVALGLAQNLAALMALVGEGIQQGHMHRHARRLAWKAGARFQEIQSLADLVWKAGTFNLEAARKLLETLREDG